MGGLISYSLIFSVIFTILAAGTARHLAQWVQLLSCHLDELVECLLFAVSIPLPVVGWPVCRSSHQCVFVAPLDELIRGVKEFLRGGGGAPDGFFT